MPFKPHPALIAVLCTLIIWFVIPVPADVTPDAWHLLALFIGTIAAIIGKALPIGAIAIIAMTLVAILGVTADTPKQAMNDALSSLSSSLIWLIGIAIMISRGLIKTGLGLRIAYNFIAIFGKKTIGIGYSLALAELLISPITPSNTARGGAIIHPIMRSIADSFGSRAEDGTQNRIGKYLALVNYHSNPITSAMFITATAPNPLVVDLIADVTGAQISLSWTTWAVAMFLPGMASILLMPLVMYVLAKPELTETPDAKTFAKEHLAKLGKVTKNEKIMLAVFTGMLLLWADIPAMIFGDALSFDATAVAFLGLSALILTGVLTWDDILKEKSAWDTIVWFAALIMMATYLSKLGLISWFSGAIQSMVAQMGVGSIGAMAILTLVYLYSHYFFASTTAHITAMFAAFYTIGIALGAPPMLFALILAASSSLMMTLTHYATGTAPVIFGSGYVTLGEWWKVGFVMSVVNLVVWIAVGLVWWKVLSYY
ncbi:C4-dicarboxylate ABC transporter [Moraxella bovoculi]|uniref:C4-dicarboxylate ABC transporter n=1 Tax=Moraxella bovoculi TaxID=386891 RepID=A0AAC8PW70_9GAMM|nr:DASS family sodium-coupled anion symporter [Moraxella bovoculi]AKG08100.1 C4-dicarboxylate ABC transporter [Moraxella bovoculi]AKG09345.1 C4-dicarboxylate ABC transporter [Moraxella bovoculi]AKG11178.1 C4-dicarboxylate ABC transporter [Moraxella bovoculi]AKG13171.1 C4-dicarboxylate ABC transporter [Moraxella bovoculi]